jgi:hypothetical protein
MNGFEIPVTLNLHAALRRLRAQGTELVWVDFLCINQEDSEEKSIQIRRMGTIYRKAKKVAVWLGDTQDIEADDITSLCAEDANTANHTLSVSARRALMQLLSRPYWTRMWIIQELAAASSIVILCGCHQLSWEVFSNAGLIAAVDKTTGNEPKTRFQQINKFRVDKLRRNPISLLEALYRSQSALSTDPKDKLYALLGLVFDGDTFILEPNYALSKEEVYTDFSLALIKNGLPLDFIYLRTSNRQIDGSLPSWVVDWSDLNDALAKREFEYILNLEPVLLDSSISRLDQQSQAHASKYILETYGFILGSINGLSSLYIATLETGEQGWVHPQSCKGDKIAKIFNCDRHVVLRPHSKSYRVVGEAGIRGLVNEPELLYKAECLRIF